MTFVKNGKLPTTFLITIGDTGERFLSAYERREYFLETKEVCKLFGNKMMLMKINEYLQKFDKDKDLSHYF
ncbi:hypothetical protein [Streptococcus dysgalactiae]|uniref:hypothetical protein n=1 Tax=Streptococcus dysgalactiae TaxID=1334 RepID=UPI003F7587D7